MNKRTDAVQWLLENPSFIDWATGNLPGDGYWEDWAAMDPTRQEAVRQARSLVNAIGGKSVTRSDEAIAEAIQLALVKAKQQEATQTGWTPVIHRSWIRQGWAVAATIAVLLGLGWWLMTRQFGQSVYDQQVTQLTQQGNTLVEISNTNQPIRYVELPDGSSVLLQKNSRISFPRQFSTAKREVYLTGEAFFEITKNPKQPFFVYANELVAKVLGTSFTVKASAEAKDIQVVVKSGKVSVFTQSDQRAAELTNSPTLSGVVLVPNEQATFDRTESRMTQEMVTTPSLLNIPIEKESFIYKETPVASLFADLEKMYGVRIQFDRDLMAHCSITATLGDDPLAQKLNWICSVLEASYQMNGETIVVSGKSCQ